MKRQSAHSADQHRAILRMRGDAGQVDHVPVQVAGHDRPGPDVSKLAHATREWHADPLAAFECLADVLG